MLSPTSPPSTGACVWRHPGACSAPALMGPQKASSMCLVTKVLGRIPGWGRRRGASEAWAYPQHWLWLPSCSAQGPHLCHLWLQPLCEHGLWEACGAAAGGHRSHGLRGVWHHWTQPHPADGQPRYRGPGTATLGRCGRSHSCSRNLRTGTCAWSGSPVPSHTLLTPTQLP